MVQRRVRGRAACAVLLFGVVGLSGCLSQPSACYAVGWPAPGSEFIFHGTFSHGVSDRNVTHRIQESAEILDGFGNKVDAIPILKSGGSIIYLDPARRQTVLHDHPSFADDNYGIDRGVTLLAHQLMGTCWTTGDTAEASLAQPPNIQTFEIIHATNDALEVMNHHPGYSTPLSTEASPDGRLFRYVYDGGEFVPKTITISDEEGMELAQWRLVAETATAAETVPPGELRPIRNDATPWLPYPDFSGFDFAGFPFSEMFEQVANEPDYPEFARNHPDARVSEATWSVIEEPESTSVEWRGLIRDDSSEAYRFLWVKRCYENETTVMIYGECEYLRSHSEGRLFPTVYTFRGAVEVEAATSEWLGASAPAGRLIEIARNFTDGGPLVRIDWQAFPTGGRLAANEFFGSPGVKVHFGTISGVVDYTAPGGPEGGGYREDTQAIWMDSSGWLLYDQVHSH